MSMSLIALALGLTTVATHTDKVEMNPHMLVADREFQDLIYKNRRLVVQIGQGQQLAFREKGVPFMRAEVEISKDPN